MVPFQSKSSHLCTLHIEHVIFHFVNYHMGVYKTQKITADTLEVRFELMQCCRLKKLFHYQLHVLSPMKVLRCHLIRQVTVRQLFSSTLQHE